VSEPVLCDNPDLEPLERIKLQRDFYSPQTLVEQFNAEWFVFGGRLVLGGVDQSAYRTLQHHPLFNHLHALPCRSRATTHRPCVITAGCRPHAVAEDQARVITRAVLYTVGQTRVDGSPAPLMGMWLDRGQPRPLSRLEFSWVPGPTYLIEPVHALGDPHMVRSLRQGYGVMYESELRWAWALWQLLVNLRL
jgi:hypothetical protein